MSQSGYTPIQLYYSTTASNTPSTSNLKLGELAFNIADNKIYALNTASNALQTVVGTLGNQNKNSVSITGGAIDGTTIGATTASTGAFTTLSASTPIGISSGGTNSSATPTSGGVGYGTGTAYAFTAAGTSNQVLISNGSSAPSWSSLSSIGVSSFSAGTTGLTPSSATTGAITLSGTLNVANGGTGITSLTANYIPYGNGTSAFSSSSNIQFNGTTLTLANDASIHGLTIGQGAGSVSTNTAIGYSALGSNTTAGYNTAIGYNAFYQANRTADTSGYNVGVGALAGSSATGGQFNTYIGGNAAANATSGSNNVCIGFYAGISLYNITTESNRICLGTSGATNAYIQVAWTVVSDSRDKADVNNSTYGLDFVNKLRPVTYKWDKRDKYENGIPDGTHKETKTNIGFLAQDVIALEKEFGAVAKDLLVADDEQDENLKITETKMIPVLVKAIQELSQKFDAYIASHP